MTLDWTLPIAIQATDWQGELPARVMRVLALDGTYLVAIQSPFRSRKDAPIYRGIELRFTPDGTCCGFPDIRVINKGTSNECLA